jgi:transcriptional pleiotropic regulator of transition state genes
MKGLWKMSDTGIVRRVDDLGRIVLPMELRRTLGINVRDPMSISVDGERIVVSKHHDSCVVCGALEEIMRVKDRAICRGCVTAVQRL